MTVVAARRTVVVARPPRVSRVLRLLALVAPARCFCRPMRVIGAPPDGPVVLAANHQSHADTAVLLRALPPRVRARTAPAAAEDYFFLRNRFLRWFSERVVGAFPFPRRGSAGIDRAEALLRAGRTVILFPEGTRSTDGRIAPFRPGVGVLASLGFRVVPVAIAGTRAVLPKGEPFPRRAPVCVLFGEPMELAGVEPKRAAACVEAAVRLLAKRASIPEGRATWYERARRLARSRAGLAVCFAWGAAEALVLPIIPDVAVALLAVVAPARFPLLALSAAAGSVAGSGAAHALGAIGIVPPLPLVTPRMAEQASMWLSDEGAGALRHQPWSGIPVKAFSYEAGAAGVPLGAFVWHTAIARGLRMVEVGAVFALAGRLGRRVAPRAYGAFCIAFAMVFRSGWCASSRTGREEGR